MRKFKNFSLAFIVLILNTLIASVGIADPRIPVDSVPAIQIKGLEKFAGLKATLFFVSGREAVVGTGGSLRTHALKAKPETVVIGQNGEVRFSGANIRRDSILVFNFVVLAVHLPDQDAVILGEKKNGKYKGALGDIRLNAELTHLTNGSLLTAKHFQTSLSKYISFWTLLDKYETQGSPSVLNLSIGEWHP
jgi:hypothetical protein